MIRKRSLEHKLKQYAGVSLGCLIASCSINLFLVPSHLLTGGATGIAIIFYYLAGLPIGLQTFLYNIPLLIAAWKLMGGNIPLILSLVPLFFLSVWMLPDFLMPMPLWMMLCWRRFLAVYLTV